MPAIQHRLRRRPLPRRPRLPTSTPHPGGALAVLAAAVLWGTAGTAPALDGVDPHPGHVAALRSVLGGIGLAGIAVALRQRRDLLALGRCAQLPWAVGGALAVATFQLCFFAGVQRTGVALGTVVALGTAPIVAGAARAALGRGRPTAGWTLATVLAISGAALMLLSGEAGSADLLGVGLAVVAGSAFAACTLVLQFRVARGHTAVATMAVAFLGSAVLLAPMLALGDVGWIGTPGGLGVTLWLGIAAAALPYALYARGLAGVPAHRALTLTLAEPLTAVLLGLLLLGERLEPAGFAGLVLVAGGLFAASARPRRPVRPARRVRRRRRPRTGGARRVMHDRWTHRRGRRTPRPGVLATSSRRVAAHRAQQSDPLRAERSRR